MTAYEQEGIIVKITELLGEATEYDKKQAVEMRKPKSWLKSVSAFANGVGGILIFGIADNGDVVGIEDIKKTSEFVSQKIKERITPIPEIIMNLHKMKDGKALLTVKVFGGQETPYYYSGDGTMEAFVRVGNESVIANATELKRLVLRGKNSSFDSLDSTYEFNDFSFSKLRERFKEWNGNSMEEKSFESFGIKEGNGKLTNAGALLADYSPIRHSRLFCTRWNGLDKSGGQVDAVDSGEYSGSLIILLNEGMSFVKRNMKTLWKKMPDSRIELPDYCERSVFESIVNGLIHRDYLINGSEVHIDMFDDRLVIYSPGGMPDGTMIQERDIDNIPSTRRNPVLADIFNRLGYMERQGSGLNKIRSAYENAVNYSPELAPEFYSSRVEFTVTLKNLNYKASTNRALNGALNGALNEVLSKEEIRLLQLLKENPYITQNDLKVQMGIARSHVQRIMKKLSGQGILERSGSKKTGYWKINEKY